jgi:hypothetical protein
LKLPLLRKAAHGLKRLVRTVPNDCNLAEARLLARSTHALRLKREGETALSP